MCVCNSVCVCVCVSTSDYVWLVCVQTSVYTCVHVWSRIWHLLESEVSLNYILYGSGCSTCPRLSGTVQFFSVPWKTLQSCETSMSGHCTSHLKIHFALAGAARLGRHPVHGKVEGSIPGWGVYWRQPVDVSFSSPSLCPSLQTTQKGLIFKMC